MSTGVPKTTNVEEVLPNDEDLGRRNCNWRELLRKYEEPIGSTENPSDQSMDIDTAMVMLDQEMSDESSVSDVVEASTEEQSAEENPEEIKQQLRRAVPLRQREWEANGLKEILDDNEFRMVSHEKVENWLRNHMHTITGNYNVHYQTQQVTTVTETRMDADADSLYSVDTAQYIRSNKQISNKLKVTTMIKQYSVTSSVRRLTSLGIGFEEQQKADAQAARLSLEQRVHRKSDSACDTNNPPRPRYNYHPGQKIPPAQHHRPSGLAALEPPKDRPNRRKVFKKTVPRKRPGASGVNRSFDRASPSSKKQQQPYDQDQVYAKALEQCARIKKNKAFCRRKVSKRAAAASRMQNTSTSSSSDSDSDEVFFAPVASSRGHRAPNAASIRPTKSAQHTVQPQPPLVVTPEKSVTPRKTSPTEREILEPFQSITLSASKRPRPHHPESSAIGPPKPVRLNEQERKRVGIQRDGCYHDEGLVIYRPKAIRPNCPTTTRINLRAKDLTLTGVTKQRHLDKFQHFNYNIHPNSTVCFYPSESSDSADDRDNGGGDGAPEAKLNGTANDTSYDDDDPILTFHPRNTKLLNVVEIPHRRRVT
ncbi:uncharacterized protein LOC120901854 [Anopheles arabiensis]|uniref:Uncharacterized protein n=1 Tax=Anopheles arabiensis TaxID=7173 RepID=A0A182HVH9_ANOAR|nr:uncharacterized protein LOC120901854 [Anopheles arabiensis]